MQVVTVVTTEAALQQAVADGVEHVEIQNHLDLGSLDTRLGGLIDHQGADSPLKSIRVRFFLCSCRSRVVPTSHVVEYHAGETQ